jgi:hypothetical protein
VARGERMNLNGAPLACLSTQSQPCLVHTYDERQNTH